MEIRTSRRRGESLLLWRLRVLYRTLLSYTVMRTGMRVGEFDPAVYRREVVENSDFRKYDDNLRMTLDCTPALADRIEQRLAKAQRDNIVRFGMHRQPAAIMTCIVPSITESNHVHFIDRCRRMLASQKLRAGVSAGSPHRAVAQSSCAPALAGSASRHQPPAPARWRSMSSKCLTIAESGRAPGHASHFRCG